MGCPESPLTPPQQNTFTGLAYFAENTVLRFALTIDHDVPHDVIVMNTSTGAKQPYRRAGKIKFSVDGENAELSVFQDEHSYFVPFRDGTNGKETYGAGRYLEPQSNPDGSLEIDFNYAYNPYCAYNDNFSCPLPPRENWLKARIEAGEKKFHN